MGSLQALSEMLATRATQWQAFARWEAAQTRESDQLDYARIQEALDWYADALEFAERHGGAGGDADAAEWHLQHLIAWVALWRRAWGAPETSEPP